MNMMFQTLIMCWFTFHTTDSMFEGKNSTWTLDNLWVSNSVFLSLLAIFAHRVLKECLKNSESHPVCFILPKFCMGMTYVLETV